MHEVRHASLSGCSSLLGRIEGLHKGVELGAKLSPQSSHNGPTSANVYTRVCVYGCVSEYIYVHICVCVRVCVLHVCLCVRVCACVRISQ